jgi:hypothetical protein
MQTGFLSTCCLLPMDSFFLSLNDRNMQRKYASVSLLMRCLLMCNDDGETQTWRNSLIRMMIIIIVLLLLLLLLLLQLNFSMDR